MTKAIKLPLMIAWNANYTNVVDNKEQSIILKSELHNTSLDLGFKCQFAVT